MEGKSWYLCRTDIERILQDFETVAKLAGLPPCDIEIEFLSAPHEPPILRKGESAIYIFGHGEHTLKVGKVSPNSGCRYTYQHYKYNPEHTSTLPKSLIDHGKEINLHKKFTEESVGDWIKANTDRCNLLLPVDCGESFRTLLEAFMQCRTKPVFEGRNKASFR